MIENMISGFLFLLILILSLVTAALGYQMENEEYNPDKDLKRINNNIIKFKTSLILALIHNGCVIALIILLFIGFSSHNLILGIILLISRIGEGLILYINDSNYWKFLNIAKKYPKSNTNEQESLSNLAMSIFKTKDQRFKLAMVCWSIGTLAFSIIIIVSGGIPEIIGWLGVIASITIGLGNGIKLVKHRLKFPDIGALLAILFEIIIGGWLLFSLSI